MTLIINFIYQVTITNYTFIDLDIMSKRLVIALGGNALGKTPQEQLDLVKGTASTIVDLVEEGYDVVIGHGNGPQVGMVNLAFEYSANNGGGTPAMPFPECGAMTQG